MKPIVLIVAIVLVGGLAAALAVAAEPAAPVVLNDDGAWCWFQDERAVVQDGKLLVASVANGTHDARRRGDIDLVVYDLATGMPRRTELFDQLEDDDHAVPALWVRPDRTTLAVFSKHGSENHWYSRVADVGAGDWGPVRRFTPSESSRITYSNLLYLAAENAGRGRLYNFFRGLDASFKPSFAVSDDGGDTWQAGSVVIDVPTQFRHRPYAKYVSNGRDTIHILYTDGHPRDFDNSIYHVFYRAGVLHRSDGTPIRALSAGLCEPSEGTRLFRGDPQNVGWVSDAHLDASGRLFAVFSVQKDSAGLKSGDERAGQDHRYHYAWWDGRAWHEREIAFGGRRLYAGEDDYTGNICLHPDRLNTVFISSDADPVSGRPLVSTADGRRHYELFRGTTADEGKSWSWHAVTRNSTVDNLRPLVPHWNADRTALLWFRGTYRTYRNYQAEVTLLLDP